MHNKKIFIAFIGPEIDQGDRILDIQDGFECWNLKKFSRAEFVQMLKAKIPPVNDNVLKNYEIEIEGPDIYGLTDKRFSECSWGILIPEALDDVIVSGYAEALFLMNLYSPAFLYPLFEGSDFGITRHRVNRSSLEYFHTQNQAKIFSTNEFVSFFKLLLPQSQYGTWQFYRAQNWQSEDWRLYVAALLFLGLRDYDNNKDVFGWQREAADMAAVLEALFTAEDVINEEIGYRLRKRIAVLLSHAAPCIEKDIKDLYKQRSAFVHGSFFARIARESKRAFNKLPLPDYDLLHKNKEYVRFALAAYLHLAHILKSEPESLGKHQSVMNMLEEAIIDIKLRQNISAETQKLLALMPRAA